MERAPLGNMEADVLVDVRAARLYLLTRERNAWHNTTSRRYKGPASLTASLEQAKREAERWRAQGSSFTIQQVPAVLLIGEEMRVAITESLSRHASVNVWTIATTARVRVRGRHGGAHTPRSGGHVEQESCCHDDEGRGKCGWRGGSTRTRQGFRGHDFPRSGFLDGAACGMPTHAISSWKSHSGAHPTARSSAPRCLRETRACYV